MLGRNNDVSRRAIRWDEGIVGTSQKINQQSRADSANKQNRNEQYNESFFIQLAFLHAESSNSSARTERTSLIINYIKTKVKGFCEKVKNSTEIASAKMYKTA